MLQKHVKLYQEITIKEQLGHPLSLDEKSFLQLCKKTLIENNDTVAHSELEKLCNYLVSKLNY